MIRRAWEGGRFAGEFVFRRRVVRGLSPSRHEAQPSLRGEAEPVHSPSRESSLALHYATRRSRVSEAKPSLCIPHPQKLDRATRRSRVSEAKPRHSPSRESSLALHYATRRSRVSEAKPSLCVPHFLRVPKAGAVLVLALAPLGARLLKKKCNVSAEGRSCACLGSRSPLACGHFQVASKTQIFHDVIV